MALYQRATNGMRGTPPREAIEKYLDAYGGFHDDVFFPIYLKGAFGRPVWDGGDGTAERLVTQKRKEAAERQEIARRLLHGLRYRAHPLSFHIWLELPEPWRNDEFIAQARRRGVWSRRPKLSYRRARKRRTQCASVWARRALASSLRRD